MAHDPRAPLHTLRNLLGAGLLGVSLLGVSCYSVPDISPLLEPTPAAASPSRDPAPLLLPPTDLGLRHEDLQRALDRLARQPGGTAPENWREAEAEKAQELAQGLCLASEAACRRALGAVAASTMTEDEVLTVLAGALGGLRSRASLAVEILGDRLLRTGDGAARDRVLRIATGAGVVRRGRADGSGRIATLLPTEPQVGRAAWLLVEFPSPCPEARGDAKGPDSAGRMDLTLSSDCGSAPQPPEAARPVARRAVWAHHLQALPEAGLTVWVDEEQPLLRWTPGPGGPVKTGGSASPTGATTGKPKSK